MNRNKTKRAIEKDPQLQDHLAELGLRTIEEYRVWCLENGFSRKLRKSEKSRSREVRFAERNCAFKKLIERKQLNCTRPQIIANIAANVRRFTCYDTQFRAAVEHAFQGVDTHPQRDALVRILRTLCTRSRLVSLDWSNRNGGWSEANQYVSALVRLAKNEKKWIRQPESVRFRSRNPHRQCMALIDHLMVQWPVPRFMYDAWFTCGSALEIKQQKWFIHLSQGGNIRQTSIPIEYTKRMAHHFLEAPATFKIAHALRWGQVIGLGGTPSLVHRLIRTRLGDSFKNDFFWSTVIRWFIRHADLSTASMNLILEYIQHRKFYQPPLFDGDREIGRDSPAEPNFTIKDRQPDTLIGLATAWRRQQAREQKLARAWKRSGLDGFEFMEGDARQGTLRMWSIRELITKTALQREGDRMHNCVATYADKCASGLSSIWTMEMEGQNAPRNQLTIEVNNHKRQINQALTVCNEPPTTAQKRVLQRWANSASLTISSRV